MARADTWDQHPRPVGQAKSAASIIAIVTAIVSFIFSGQGREGIAFVLALTAIAAGLIGSFKAMSPRVSGGILSITAIVLGGIAVIVALVALVV